MRFIFPTVFILTCIAVGCSESAAPQPIIVKTLEVVNSSSTSREFRGSLENVGDGDTILTYGFEWENRYGDWNARKSGRLKKGKFYIRDHTPLSKWSTFTVRAFIETKSGFIYGDSQTFTIEGK